MKKLFVSIAALVLFSAPAFAEPPAWWTALHGSYLPADELAQMTFPTSANCPEFYTCTPNPVAKTPTLPVALPQPIEDAAVGAAASVLASTSTITYLPKWYGSVGGGGIVPGHGGTFAYESISAYIGAQTYATTVQEYTISNGKVQSCTMAGAAKILYQVGFVSIGLTGLGGGCNSTSGSSGMAGAAQGFASSHLGKTGISIVATGDKTFTTDGRQAVKLTLGVSYGK